MTRERAKAVAKETSREDPINQYALVHYGRRTYGVCTVFSARFNGDEILEAWHGGKPMEVEK